MVYEGLKTLDDVDLHRKRVFLRVDYNVPIDKDGNITDDSRIRESLPTIKAIFAKGASQILIASHLGRPKDHEKELRMDKVADRIVFLLKRRVEKLDDCINIDDLLPEPNEASIVVLENLRFYPEEENDDESFAKKLAKNSDFYVFIDFKREQVEDTSGNHFFRGSLFLSFFPKKDNSAGIAP